MLAKRKTVFHIETSGWSYSHWKGTFCPVDIRDEYILGYYCEHFTTVEINNSFYHIPKVEIIGYLLLFQQR